MEIAELTAYASEKYQIAEQHKWADFPGFSVLCHPKTGKWIALLMRQWDGERGEEIERCDLKCGSSALQTYRKPYLSSSIRMKGGQWINISFDAGTESEVVFELFDRAVEMGNPYGYTVVLASQLPSPKKKHPDTPSSETNDYQDTPLFSGKSGYQDTSLFSGKIEQNETAGDTGYHDTPIVFSGRGPRPEEERIPERIREMRRMYDRTWESAADRAEIFCRQAVFMADYEDDYPWKGDLIRYFPTYRDLSVRQLRGYFSWRTDLRKGKVREIPASAAYLYIYELLNGVGAASPEESLEKLKAFEYSYLDAGFGDARMRANLHRWMLEYAVLNDLPADLAGKYADPELLARDRAVLALKEAGKCSDEEVFSALCFFAGKKLENSPAATKDPERGMHLFSEAWRAALSYRKYEKDLFTLCFGTLQVRTWHPLSNAVYFQKAETGDREYVLTGCRIFRRKNGAWQTEAYEKLYFDRVRFQGFVHEADVQLRRYLKTGRYLKENSADEWAAPYIAGAIEADKEAFLEASRPKITIDLSVLPKIRSDAEITRDSLLTEEELDEIPAPQPEPAVSAGIPLDPVEEGVLRALLSGRDPLPLIREQHRMPSMVADAINEAFFDEIGDTVLLCEGDALALVEDYIEDLENLLGGDLNGGA